MTALRNLRQWLSSPHETDFLTVKAAIFAGKAFIVHIETRRASALCLEFRSASSTAEEFLHGTACFLDCLFHDVAADFFQPLVRCRFELIVDFLADDALRNALLTFLPLAR